MGNPPYVTAKTMSQEQPYERDAINRLYESAKGNWDLYVHFVELGVNILKTKGILTFVTPNKIIGADYVRSLHQSILFPNKICSVLDFTNIKTYTSAKVSVVAVVVQKEGLVDEPVVFKQFGSQEDVRLESRVPQDRLMELPWLYWVSIVWR